MLEIKNLSVKYQHKLVLNNLQVSFKEGQIHGLVGLNGSGKTTFLNTMYKIVESNAEAEMLWHESALKRKHIAYLESENFFYPMITGGEYLALFQAANPNFAFKKWAALFHLPLKRLIDQYSTGMKKKLALLGVLSLNRKLIFLDEPYNGMDLETSLSVKQVLKYLQTQGYTIIITSHILESLTSICNEIHYLCDGKISKSFKQNEFSIIENHLNKDFISPATLLNANLLNLFKA